MKGNINNKTINSRNSTGGNNFGNYGVNASGRETTYGNN